MFNFPLFFEEQVYITYRNLLQLQKTRVKYLLEFHEPRQHAVETGARVGRFALFDAL